MRSIFLILLIVVVSLLNALPIYAQEKDRTVDNCDFIAEVSPSSLKRDGTTPLTVRVPANRISQGYKARIGTTGSRVDLQLQGNYYVGTFRNDQAAGYLEQSGEDIYLVRPGDTLVSCKMGFYRVDLGETGCSITITNSTNEENKSCGDASTQFNVEIKGAIRRGEILRNVELAGKTGFTLGSVSLDQNGNSTNATIPASSLKIGPDHAAYVKVVASGDVLCQTSTQLVVLDNQEACEDYLNAPRAPGIFNLCQQAGSDANGVNECESCLNNSGVWTALGCLPTRPADLLPKLAQFAVGIAGGFALMLMLIGAFRISVSAGNPDNVQAGKDMFTSAVAGLLLIIFSALILRIIGVDIFQLPGF